MTGVLVKRIVRFVGGRLRPAVFDEVGDSRGRRGRRWKSSSLLMATLVGLVMMERSFRGIERATRDLGGGRRRLGIGRRVPDSTIWRFFRQLDDEDGLRKVLVGQIKRAQRSKSLAPFHLPIGVVAIDGKNLWSGHAPIDDPACQCLKDDAERADYRIHTLHAVLVTARSQPCIDQLLVPGKTNEMGSLPKFIEQLQSSYGHGSLYEVISVDAGMTSAENARVLTDAGLRYVMAIKENQPELLREAQRLCGWGGHKQNGYSRVADTPWQRYKGKRIRRELFRSTQIHGWPGWPSIKQVWRVKQTTEDGAGVVTVENRYFATSLPKDRLTAREILELVRLHWGVENGCHWTMDVILGEDDHVLCTKGKAVRMLSWMRLLAYNMLRLLKDCYLRSDKNRAMPWDDMRRLVTQAFQDVLAWRELGRDQGQPAPL